MNRVIIAGSPRSGGRSAHLAEMLFEANIDECPEDELYLVPVSELEIAPCIGCGACRVFAGGKMRRAEGSGDAENVGSSEGPEDAAFDAPIGDAAERVGADGASIEPAPSESDGPSDSSNDGPSDNPSDDLNEIANDDELAPDYPYCLRFDDDMQDVYALLHDADELTVVAPVFFSGAPASLKALLDRLQPHFWAGTRNQDKRPAILHVVGEGGDPHGYGALVSEVRSALSVAGFKLERVLDWVGKIDEKGEITAEAEVVEDAAGAQAQNQRPAERPARQPDRARPKLDLKSSQKSKKAPNKGSKQSGKGKRHG